MQSKTALIEQVRAARRLPPPVVARAIRDAAGVTQQQLADELHINRVSLARYECGARRPRGDLRLRYAELLEQLQEATA